MKPTRTCIVTQNLDFASLWNEKEELGNSAAVLGPAQDPLTKKLWGLRFPNIEILETPGEALAWAPDVAVMGEPGYSRVAPIFTERGIDVVGGSSFLDQLALDPEISRNALTTLFNPQNSRRFIPLHPNPQMVQGEALYYSLRFPEEKYIFDIGDTRESLVTLEAPEILQGLEKFGNLTKQASPDIYCKRVGGLMAHKNDWPVLIFSIGGIYSSGWVGAPILYWEFLQDRVAAWLPHESEMLGRLSSLCQSYKIKGVVSLQCCLDSAGQIQVFRMGASLPYWVSTWLRSSISPSQSWGSLWAAIARGAKFNYEEGAQSLAWVLGLPRDSGLLASSAQSSRVWRGFTQDFLLGTEIWKPQHFDLKTIEALSQVLQAGVMNKRPLWACAEISKIEEFTKDWKPKQLPEMPQTLPSGNLEEVVTKEEPQCPQPIFQELKIPVKPALPQLPSPIPLREEVLSSRSLREQAEPFCSTPLLETAQ